MSSSTNKQNTEGKGKEKRYSACISKMPDNRDAHIATYEAHQQQEQLIAEGIDYFIPSALRGQRRQQQRVEEEGAELIGGSKLPYTHEDVPIDAPTASSAAKYVVSSSVLAKLANARGSSSTLPGRSGSRRNLRRPQSATAGSAGTGSGGSLSKSRGNSDRFFTSTSSSPVFQPFNRTRSEPAPIPQVHAAVVGILEDGRHMISMDGVDTEAVLALEHGGEYTCDGVPSIHKTDDGQRQKTETEVVDVSDSSKAEDAVVIGVTEATTTSAAARTASGEGQYLKPSVAAIDLGDVPNPPFTVAKKTTLRSTFRDIVGTGKKVEAPPPAVPASDITTFTVERPSVFLESITVAKTKLSTKVSEVKAIAPRGSAAGRGQSVTSLGLSGSFRRGSDGAVLGGSEIPLTRSFGNLSTLSESFSEGTTGRAGTAGRQTIVHVKTTTVTTTTRSRVGPTQAMGDPRVPCQRPASAGNQRPQASFEDKASVSSSRPSSAFGSRLFRRMQQRERRDEGMNDDGRAADRTETGPASSRTWDFGSIDKAGAAGAARPRPNSAMGTASRSAARLREAVERQNRAPCHFPCGYGSVKKRKAAASEVKQQLCFR